MALSPGASAFSPQVNDDNAIVFNHANPNVPRRNETAELSTSVALSPGASAFSPQVNFHLSSNYDVAKVASGDDDSSSDNEVVALAPDDDDANFEDTGMVPLGFGLPSPSKSEDA